jgi:hypothetical protein
MNGERLIVNERFCGPPGTGNGGYVAGLLARPLGARVEVMLRRPTPIGAQLSLRPSSDGWHIETEDDRVLLAEGRPVESRPPSLVPPAAPDFEQAVRASESLPAHPFPRCFVCGPDRAEGDGLRIFAGPLRPGRYDVVAAPWVPDASLCSDGELVDTPFLWSALDCPGAMVAMEDQTRPILLARMTAELPGRVRRGERCVVVGWRIARDGRKHTTGTALYGEDGTLRGASEQLWIEPRKSEATRRDTVSA